MGPLGLWAQGGRLVLKDPGLKDLGPMGPGAQGAPQAIGGPRSPPGNWGGPRGPPMKKFRGV